MDESTDAVGTYFVEVFRSAREELLKRVMHRDRWLMFQLVAQSALFAMSLGIRIFGAETSVPQPQILCLSIPVSFVLALLYFVEDRLVGHLSTFVGSVADNHPDFRAITNWDGSRPLKDYTKTTLVMKYLAQLTAFAAIPWWLYSFKTGRNLLPAEPELSAILWLSIVLVVTAVFVSRLGLRIGSRALSITKMFSRKHFIA